MGPIGRNGSTPPRKSSEKGLFTLLSQRYPTPCKHPRYGRSPCLSVSLHPNSPHLHVVGIPALAELQQSIGILPNICGILTTKRRDAISDKPTKEEPKVIRMTVTWTCHDDGPYKGLTLQESCAKFPKGTVMKIGDKVVGVKK